MTTNTISQIISDRPPGDFAEAASVNSSIRFLRSLSNSRGRKLRRTEMAILAKVHPERYPIPVLKDSLKYFNF